MAFGLLSVDPEEDGPMPIARITGQGLTAIAFSVALLWGCVIGQRSLEKRAYIDRARVLRDIERLHRRQGTEPAAAPLRLRTRPAQTTAT